MNYAKKMILVDPNVVQQMQHVKETKPKTLNLLDEEMQTILENKTLPDNEKWIMYEQVLQKYLNIVNNDRQPMQIPIVVTQQAQQQTQQQQAQQQAHQQPQQQQPPQQQLQQQSQQPQQTSSPQTITFASILSTLPRSLRNNGNMFLQTLTKDGNISWNDKGVVQVNGNIINNSNITDLVNDFIRNRKNTYEPKGWKKFADVLREMNMPLELVRSTKRREYITSKFDSSRSLLDEAAGGISPYSSAELNPVSEEKSLYRKKSRKSKTDTDQKSRRSFWEAFNL